MNGRSDGLASLVVPVTVIAGRRRFEPITRCSPASSCPRCRDVRRGTAPGLSGDGCGRRDESPT